MSDIVAVSHLSKTFQSDNGQIKALDDVSFEVKKGEIFGIIGLSGAGKSTLVRCLNLLEVPTQGKISVLDEDLCQLSQKQLRLKRRKIGMIFQSFNLLSQKKVIDNVLFPCKISKLSKQESKDIALKYLDRVGLLDRQDSYPAQLSGGQKQRVAIARALAAQPELILCDEPTSALDPQTSKAILSLLKEINKELNITIIIITHQMSVIQQICDRCLVLEDGKVAEINDVEALFNNPTSRAAKNLILSSPKDNKVDKMQGGKIIRVVFSAHSSLEPVIANLVLEFKTPVNILRSDLTTVNGVSKGEMYLQLPSEIQIANKMIDYLKDKEFISISEVYGE